MNLWTWRPVSKQWLRVLFLSLKGETGGPWHVPHEPLTMESYIVVLEIGNACVSVLKMLRFFYCRPHGITSRQGVLKLGILRQKYCFSDAVR